MDFRTIVNITTPDFQIAPLEPILVVGSCFADKIGRRFEEERFPVTVNPFGVMYNPASILHTVQRCDAAPRIAFFTLGTSHVYRLKETGEIVDNCQKRPQNLFQEEELTIDQCVDYLSQAADELQHRCPDVHIVLTVSPIRYAKYGYHGSQLSKSTLLLSIEEVLKDLSLITLHSSLYYFPAYEIVNDELRDYRFYAPDMLHPTAQTVDYIWQRLVETCFSDAAKQYLEEWQPLKRALAHRPFNPESEEYRKFMEVTKTHLKAFETKWKVPS